MTAGNGSQRLNVTVHVAQSLDGRLALRGLATPLSTVEGQRSAHSARAANDAVLVGRETVRIDDPRLTVRHVEGRSPLRVVLASRLDLPTGARVFSSTSASSTSASSRSASSTSASSTSASSTSASEPRVLVIGARGLATDAARDALVTMGADVLIVEATSDGMVSLPHAMEALAARGVKNLLVEGGARVLTSFFRAQLVQHVEIEIAMLVLGAPGTALLGVLGVDGVDGLGRAPKLANVRVERLGSSVLVRGDVVSSAPPS